MGVHVILKNRLGKLAFMPTRCHLSIQFMLDVRAKFALRSAIHFIDVPRSDHKDQFAKSLFSAKYALPFL